MSSGVTVVVVDNEPEIREFIHELLASRGINVVTAGDGREAFAYLAEHDLPSLILLDFNMPNMDGFQFRAMQLKDERLRSVPVVFMTAINQIPHQSSEMNTRCLKKPFETEDLFDAIAPYVTKRIEGDLRV
jgi:CheY-like chemotaxis protein